MILNLHNFKKKYENLSIHYVISIENLILDEMFYLLINL